MPELPEVETLRRGLEAVIISKSVARVQVSGKRSVRRQSKSSFVAGLKGRRIIAARRKGKYLLVDLDDESVLVVHLRMSGQLRFETDPRTPRDDHTHVVIGFSDKSELRFVDPRTFGEMFLSRSLDDERVPSELASLGIDPVLQVLDAPYLHERLLRRRIALKAFLLAQNELCGIGNIYADEICFLAGLRPDRAVDTLDLKDTEELIDAINTVLGAAIKGRGSSLRDERYRDLAGELGGYQSAHAVYDRAEQPCLVCETAITRITIVGRSAHYCAHCQT